MEFENTGAFAKNLDDKDDLRDFQSKFYFPKKNNKKCIYMAGHSLGLQPKNSKKYIDEIFESWKNLAVDGHFKGENPWWTYHEKFKKPLGKLVGAKESEVTVMNTLSVNLHLLLTSFYRPKNKRIKILCESKAFPSDQYVLESQVKWHGLNPKEVIEVISCRDGENELRTEDIINKIKELDDSLALVFLGGVNYYSGQVMDIKSITKIAQNYGAKIGWDLAHAAGNIELQLHNWNVDFASWCSYKYMNAGPGSISGVFIHEKYHSDNDIFRLTGWWGNKKESRFMMKPFFDPINSADGWQISNISIFSMAPYYASLLMFDKIGMKSIIIKRDLITSYLEFIINDINKRTETKMKIITPLLPNRGSQLSILFKEKGKAIFDFLDQNEVILDWREPNVIRLAPVPLYTSFSNIFNFGVLLEKAMKSTFNKLPLERYQVKS